jgi:hypothetical protein
MEIGMKACCRKDSRFKPPRDFGSLHSNKTFRYTFMQVLVVERYRADGKGIRISAQQREPFTWEVKGNDQVCVSYQSVTRCWQYQRSNKDPREYIGRETSGERALRIIKVEDGIPQF